jgi:hypothetical protein
LFLVALFGKIEMIAERFVGFAASSPGKRDAKTGRCSM